MARTFSVTWGLAEGGLWSFNLNPNKGVHTLYRAHLQFKTLEVGAFLFNTLGPKAFYLMESTLKCLSIKIKKAWRKSHECLIPLRVHTDILSASLRLGLKGKTLLTFQSTTSLRFKYLAILKARVDKGNLTLCISIGSCSPSEDVSRTFFPSG